MHSAQLSVPRRSATALTIENRKFGMKAGKNGHSQPVITTQRTTSRRAVDDPLQSGTKNQLGGSTSSKPDNTSRKELHGTNAEHHRSMIMQLLGTFAAFNQIYDTKFSSWSEFLRSRLWISA